MLSYISLGSNRDVYMLTIVETFGSPRTTPYHLLHEGDHGLVA
jgi:hypothetical protein